MPIVVCLIEKKPYSTELRGTPRSGPSFYPRDVCDANLEGDCHGPPPGQLFSGFSSSSTTHPSSLIDFNQINSIFLEFFANLEYLRPFYNALRTIVTSGYMNLLSASDKSTYIRNLNEFKKNIERLNILNDLCRKDIENLDIPEIWKLLLHNQELIKSPEMRSPEKIEVQVKDSRRRLDELYEVLTMEEKKREMFPSREHVKNVLLDTSATMQYSTVLVDTKKHILSDRLALIQEKIEIMRRRVVYHSNKTFPPNHNYSKALTEMLGVGSSFTSANRKRIAEVIEWYLFILEIELECFDEFESMAARIRTLHAQLMDARRIIDINAERILRTSSESTASSESITSNESSTSSELVRSSENTFLEEAEKELLERFLDDYADVFSLERFDALLPDFLAQDFYTQSPFVDDLVQQEFALHSSFLTGAAQQSSKIDVILKNISTEKEFHDSLIEFQATIALCQFYNQQHTMTGRNLYCYLYSHMNGILSKKLDTGALESEKKLFLWSKRLFPLSLIEHLKQAKTILCAPGVGIQGFISLTLEDLLQKLHRSIESKKDSFFTSQSLKRSFEADIAFLGRVEQRRLQIAAQLSDLNDRASNVLFENETDYLRRCHLFALSVPSKKRSEKDPLIISHVNYVDSNLLFLCLHYLNYAWGYSTQQSRHNDKASPYLIYANEDDVDDFAEKLKNVFTDTSKSIVQILFVFKKIHFIGACLRTLNSSSVHTSRGLESARKFVVLESGDLVVIPRSYLLKIQDLCEIYNIEFDNQIGHRKQIGANCGFIALETMGFLSQPTLSGQNFSARKVSEYIEIATGAASAVRDMGPAVPNNILSAEGQRYAATIERYINDGRLRLRLRWAQFAQQAYADPIFRDHIQQSLKDTLDFEGVVLDPDLEVYSTGHTTETFRQRMQSDCFPLPPITRPTVIRPTAFPFSSSSSASAFSSSSSSSSSSAPRSPFASSSSVARSPLASSSSVPRSPLESFSSASSSSSALEILNNPIKENHFGTPMSPPIFGSFDSRVGSLPRAPTQMQQGMRRLENPFSPDSMLSPVTPRDTPRGSPSSVAAGSPFHPRPTFSTESSSPRSPLRQQPMAGQMPGSPRTQTTNAPVSPLSSPRTPVILNPAEPIVAERKEKKKKITWSEWWHGKKPPTT